MESHHLETAPVPVVAALRSGDDEQLVVGARDGDLAAFGELVGRHGQRVYRLVLGITGNDADAEDALQEAFIKAYQHIRELQGASKFGWWLMRIATNEGLEILRKRRSDRSLEEWEATEEGAFQPRSLRPWEANPEQRYSQTQIRELVEKEIRNLPSKYRVAVILRDLEQLSTEEAAVALGLNRATLKTRLLRGRQMLRAALAPHFGRKALPANVPEQPGAPGHEGGHV